MRIHIEKADSKVTVTCGTQKAVVYSTVCRGKPSWSLKLQGPTGRVSRTFTSEAVAVAAAEEAVTASATAATTAIPGLTAKDIMELLTLKSQMAEVAPRVGRRSGVTAQKAADEFLASRSKKGCGARTIATLKHHLSKFTRVFGSKDIAGISVAEFGAFLDRIKNPRTRLNVRGSIISLGNYAKKQQWLPHGVPSAFDNSDRPIVKTPEHAVYTPDELAAILAEAEKSAPKLIPWIVLGAFAGIRAAERARMSWNLIDLTHRTIILGTHITKTAMRRPVEISDNLAAWLTKYKDQPILPIKDPTGLYIAIRDLAKRAGVPWKKNALRASAATYHLLKYENPGKTSLHMGHSERELKTVYFQPALRPYVEAWWSIMPSETS